MIRTTVRTLALLILFSPHHVWADEADLLLTPQTTPVESKAASGMPTLGDNATPRVVGSLAIVLGGFLLLTILLRRPGEASRGTQVMETLGAVQITPKVQLHLVRFGSRLLMLHLGNSSVQCVAEISDAEEVRRLLANEDPGAGITRRVSELLRETGGESHFQVNAEA